MVPANSPWLNSAVVSCDEDDSKDVPDGVRPAGQRRHDHAVTR